MKFNRLITFLAGAFCGAGVCWSVVSVPHSRDSSLTPRRVVSHQTGPGFPGYPASPVSSSPHAGGAEQSTTARDTLLAAAEEFDESRARDLQERAANDRAVWAPFYSNLLDLSEEQIQRLAEAETPQQMEKLLKTKDFLSATQSAKMDQFEKERSLNYSEITAQRQMAWVQEHLPLTTPEKDRLWRLLSDHALALTEAGGDLAKRGDLTEQLRHQVQSIMPPAAAGVALSYLASGLEDPPPPDDAEASVPEEDDAPPAASGGGSWAK